MTTQTSRHSFPKTVVATSGNAQLAVTWTAPANTGGSAITDYLVKYSANSGSTWTNFIHPVSTLTSCTITGLTNGTSYIIKVIAKNAVGISLPSASSAPATPAATVPGSPTSVVAGRGHKRQRPTGRDMDRSCQHWRLGDHRLSGEVFG
ncbi:MAG: fibronectin type III domain-containing protein [Planctomycetia bacterium]|nr:fibronectin type III domain-containing protein [Planctomycetia bacterium]